MAEIIGKRVRERRKGLVLTQIDLAARIGKPQGWVARIESGKNNDLEVSTLITLAKGLDCSLEYLVGMPEPVSTAVKPARRRARVDV
jgi:transcriptional regulator with XRE-family HTH domain